MMGRKHYSKLLLAVLISSMGFGGVLSAAAGGSAQPESSATKPSIASYISSKALALGVSAVGRFVLPAALCPDTFIDNHKQDAVTHSQALSNIKKSFLHKYGSCKPWSRRFWGSPQVSGTAFRVLWGLMGGPSYVPTIYRFGVQPVLPNRLQQKSAEQDNHGFLSKINWHIAVPATLLGIYVAWNYFKHGGISTPSFSGCATEVGKALAQDIGCSVATSFLLEEANYLFNIDNRVAGYLDQMRDQEEEIIEDDVTQASQSTHVEQEQNEVVSKEETSADQGQVAQPEMDQVETDKTIVEQERVQFSQHNDRHCAFCKKLGKKQGQARLIQVSAIAGSYMIHARCKQACFKG